MQSQPVKKRWGSAIAGTAVIATVIASAAGIAANAAPDDTNEGLGKFLGGNVAGIDLDSILSLGGAYAENPSGVDTHDNPLDVTVLDALNIDLTGTELIGDTGALELGDPGQAGVVSQRAEALDDGSAGAGSGAITSDGAIAIDAEPADGVSSASLDLDAFLGTGDIIETLELNIGALAAVVNQASGGAPVPDYLIDDFTLDFESELVGDVYGEIETLIETLETTLGGLEESLEGLIEANIDLGALATIDAAVSLGLPDLDLLLPTSTTTDGVTVDLSSGTVSIDLEALLVAAGQDLNNLPANTDLLAGALLTTITDTVLSTVTGIVESVETAIITAINGITITGSADITLAGGLAGIDIDITGDLLLPEVTAEGTGTLALLNPLLALLGVTLDTVDELLAGIIGTQGGTLISGVLSTLTDEIDDITDVLGTTVVGPVFGLIDGLLNLVVNQQPTSAPINATTGDLIGTNSNSFTVRALQIGLLSTVGDGGLATINLASATVRVDGETDADADVTDADVADGTDVDTDAVADQDGDADTTDGDTDADSDADADADADAPAGDGDADGNLATTGFDGMVLGGFGILALLTGLALYLARRKSIEV